MFFLSLSPTRSPHQLLLFFILSFTIYLNVQFILDANRLLKEANQDSGERWFVVSRGQRKKRFSLSNKQLI